MAAHLATDAPSVTDELDTVTVSRMLTGSRAVPVAVVREGRFAFANPAFISLFGPDAGFIGLPLMEVIAAESRAAMRKALSDPAETPVTFQGRVIRRDGSSFDAELLLAREMLDGVPMLCVFAEDVTWRQLSEKNLIDLAYTDMLTGLANRALVLDRLRDALVEARGSVAGLPVPGLPVPGLPVSGLAVLMADLDGLKRVNDTYGHQAGDVVLQVTAQRFLGCIRERDTLGRLGGDEFCVLLPRVRDGIGAGLIADRLVEAARQPIPINGRDVCVGVSIGIALFPINGETSDALIAAADAALYEAKRGGRNRYATASALASPAAISLPLFIWTAAHDVGIATIDKQHRKLAAHLNDLAASLSRGDEMAAVSVKLASTLSYARHHFDYEERLMDAHDFADAAAHRASHVHLLNDLRNFSAGCDTRSLSLTTRFLQEWLLRHSDGPDRELAKALRARGVE